MPRLHGEDVSAYQPDWAPRAGDAFAFVKATEARTWASSHHAGQVAKARKAGLIVGHYHFLHPGNAAEQAAHFIRHARPAHGDLLVCDWENTNTGHPSVRDAAEFIAAVRRMAPQCRVGLYCSRSDWMSTAVKAGDFLWVASVADDAGNPSTREPDTGPTPWLFWQYTWKPLDRNWCRWTDKQQLATWARGLIPKSKPPAKPRTVADAVPVLAAEVPVKAWGDVDLIQAFDVFGGTLVALQAQPRGSTEDTRVRWHTITKDDADPDRLPQVRYVATDTCRGAGHAQTVNLNTKVNLPWSGRKATFRRGKPRRNPLGSKQLPVASWPKTATGSRTATSTEETYTYAHGKVKRSRKVRKSGGVFQGACVTATHIFRVNGKTVDSGTRHKVTVSQFDWSGRLVGVRDLTPLLKQLNVTSLEPEGVSYCQLPGDTRPYLYVGVRTGSIAKRRYLLFRLAF